MRNKNIIFNITLIILLSWSPNSFSLKEKTHQVINEHVAQNAVSGFSLNTYLINNLGFREGSDVVLEGVDTDGKTRNKEVFWWLGYGGEQEDRPGSTWDFIRNNPTRSVNHFHNPLKTNWNDAGLNDLWKTGQSSILWAQNTNQSLGGNWSWQDTREYFYIALTGKDFTGTVQAPTQQDREKYFAKTFRGIGQLMHLVEDASVPEHVRNDAHILKAYEGYVLDFQTKQILWNELLANPISFNKAILNIPSESSAPVPISRIVDTDLYDGSNPNITTTVNNSPQNIGLAEYTNANFASPDTIFKEDLAQTDPHYFPYPNKLSTNLQELISKSILPETVTTEDGVQQPTLYIKKDKDGEIIDHFIKPKYTTTSRQDYIGGKIYELDFYQDEAVYEDYAKLLLPRAVGYSAGLLNYFFRGDIGLISEGGGYVITNNSAEEMEGMFELYQEDSNGVRTRIWNGQLILGPSGSGNNHSSNVAFPGTAGKYMLVFSGRIGNEYGAVAGRVVEILQGELAVFFVNNGKVSRCNTRYADLMNEVPCQSVVIADNAYGGPLYSALPNYYSRTTQKSFLHKGNKIYLIKHLPGIGKAKIYLFDPYIKQSFMLSDDYFSDEDFMNASDQYIYTSKYYTDDIQVFSYDGNGVINDKGTYHPGNWTSYVSPEGDVYKLSKTVTPIETGIPPILAGYIDETKLYTYNIFTGTLTEVIDHEYLSKDEIHWGGPEYHFALDMMHKSTIDGIRAEFQPYIRSISSQLNGQNGWDTIYDFTVFGDNYHSTKSCDAGNNCTFTGDRVATIGAIGQNRQIYSTLYNSSQGNRSGLLIPHDAEIPFTQYEWAVSSADSLQNIVKRISKLSTPYEVFESDTEYLEMGNFSVFIEDIIDRNLLISGFSMKHTAQADPANYYYELVLYNQNGERIDQKLMNVLGITNPENLKGIKLLD